MVSVQQGIPLCALVHPIGLPIDTRGTLVDGLWHSMQVGIGLTVHAVAMYAIMYMSHEAYTIYVPLHLGVLASIRACGTKCSVLRPQQE